MEAVFYILKRSNGCYGVYKNGKTQKHLISNSFMTDRVEHFLDRILYELKNHGGSPRVIITDNEVEFRDNLPSLEDFIKASAQ